MMRSFRSKSGWFRDNYRHYLAAKYGRAGYFMGRRERVAKINEARAAAGLPPLFGEVQVTRKGELVPKEQYEQRPAEQRRGQFEAAAPKPRRITQSVLEMRNLDAAQQFFTDKNTGKFDEVGYQEFLKTNDMLKSLKLELEKLQDQGASPELRRAVVDVQRFSDGIDAGEQRIVTYQEQLEELQEAGGDPEKEMKLINDIEGARIRIDELERGLSASQRILENAARRQALVGGGELQPMLERYAEVAKQVYGKEGLQAQISFVTHPRTVPEIMAAAGRKAALEEYQRNVAMRAANLMADAVANKQSMTEAQALSQAKLEVPKPQVEAPKRVVALGGVIGPETASGAMENLEKGLGKLERAQQVQREREKMLGTAPQMMKTAGPVFVPTTSRVIPGTAPITTPLGSKLGTVGQQPERRYETDEQRLAREAAAEAERSRKAVQKFEQEGAAKAARRAARKAESMASTISWDEAAAAVEAAKKGEEKKE
jgi:hypothetical protein